MLISDAYAQAAGAPSGLDFVSLLPLFLIFIVFYFLLIRPQQKRMRDHRDMIAALKKGDRVVTGGGVIGQVVKVEESDDALVVEIAPNVRIRVVRSTVANRLSVTPGAAANEDAPKGAQTAAAQARPGLMDRLFRK
jgi:preprotein translocase subunit YajC